LKDVRPVENLRVEPNVHQAVHDFSQRVHNSFTGIYKESCIRAGYL
jgi:hypothetical protein